MASGNSRRGSGEASIGIVVTRLSFRALIRFCRRADEQHGNRRLGRCLQSNRYYEDVSQELICVRGLWPLRTFYNSMPQTVLRAPSNYVLLGIHVLGASIVVMK